MSPFLGPSLLGSTTESRRQYRVQRVLGTGGFGTVYLADLLGAGGFVRPVAIKIANPDAFDQKALSRLMDEANMLARVRHRAIVAVDNLVRLDGQLAMVMEYVDGISLAQVIGDAPMPPRAALEIIAELASALDTAYKTPSEDGQPLQLVHRDIKPANVLVTASGELKLLDFGVAKARLANRNAPTTRHYVPGSMGYMAPERISNKAFGPPADIFALGALLYELLKAEELGQIPVAPERYRSHVNTALAELGEVIGAESPLVQLVGNLLSRVPEDRPDARALMKNCYQLMDRAPGERLFHWAEERVPALRGQADTAGADVRTGHVFTEETLDPEMLAQLVAREAREGDLERTTGILKKGFSGRPLLPVTGDSLVVPAPIVPAPSPQRRADPLIPLVSGGNDETVPRVITTGPVPAPQQTAPSHLGRYLALGLGFFGLLVVTGILVIRALLATDPPATETSSAPVEAPEVVEAPAAVVPSEGSAPALPAAPEKPTEEAPPPTKPTKGPSTGRKSTANPSSNVSTPVEPVTSNLRFAQTEGDPTSVQVEAGGAWRSLPAELPAGDYKVRASFSTLAAPKDMGTVTLPAAGEHYTLTCLKSRPSCTRSP